MSQCSQPQRSIVWPTSHVTIQLKTQQWFTGSLWVFIQHESQYKSGSVVSSFETHLISIWQWSRESVQCGCKVLWIGQHTLTPLIYPNKHSSSLPLDRGVITETLRCSPAQTLTAAFNTAQPAFWAFASEATQDTHSHTLAHTHNHSIISQTGVEWGNRMSGKEALKPVGKQNFPQVCSALFWPTLQEVWGGSLDL